jgi:hypothetical protein
MIRYWWIVRQHAARGIPGDSAGFDLAAVVVQQAVHHGIALHRL